MYSVASNSIFCTQPFLIHLQTALFKAEIRLGNPEACNVLDCTLLDFRN